MAYLLGAPYSFSETVCPCFTVSAVFLELFKVYANNIIPFLFNEVIEGASLTKASWGWFKAGSELLRDTPEDC